MDIESISAIIFLIILSLLIILTRKKLTIQKIIFPLLYFGMYKTNLGLKTMDSMSKRFPKLLKNLANFGIFIGFLGMALIAFTLVQNIINIFLTPAAAPGVALVLPFKVKGGFYVPFFYWIISIFIIAVVHEFSHGVVARLYNLKVKSSGFAFLAVFVPIIPAAFVEPDEEEVKKKPKIQQLGMFAAGPFSNILLAFIVLALTFFLVAPLVQSVVELDGVKITDFTSENDIIYPAEIAGMQKGETVKQINETKISSLTNFTDYLKTKRPGETISIITTNSTYNIVLASHPEDSNSSYLGVFVQQSSIIQPVFKEKYGEPTAKTILWIAGLFYWLFILNLGIGLFNLVPLGPIDGGRMLHTALQRFYTEEKAEKIWKITSMIFLLLILANIGFSFI